MYKCKMKPYEGQKPYIFISYAHKNSDSVLPVIDTLSDLGYRVWYDDGIAPGSEWPEYIATHLTASSIVLAFISPDSIDSPNCRREVTYALSRNIPFIGVYLCDTKMSPGMELQLSAQQCLFKHHMSDEKFYAKLGAVQDMIPCREIPVVNADSPEHSEANDTAAPAQTADAVKQTTPQEAKKPEKAGKLFKAGKAAKAAKPAKAEKPVKEKPASKKHKLGKRLLLIPAAIVVIIIIAAVIVPALNKVTIAGQEYDKSVSSITLSDLTVDDTVTAELGKLNSLSSLSLKNCTVSTDLSSIDLSDLSTFKAESCSLSDLSFLKDAVSLYRLSLQDCQVTDETFPDLTGAEKLQYVDLENNTSFSAISLLPVENLSELNIKNTSVSDFTAIANAEGLDTLDISGTAITDTSAPLHSLSMKEIAFDGINTNDLTFLDSLTKLESLSAENCAISDISSVLEKNSGTLKAIRLSGNSLNAETITALSGCSPVTELYLNGTPLENLDFVSNMTGLETLSASSCGISDVSGISDLTALKYLYLNDNDISSVSLSAFTEYGDLYLNNNEISDFSGIPKVAYHNLLIQGNPVDLSTIGGFSDDTVIRTLVLDYAEGMETSSVLQSANYLYIIDCPLDKQLAIEDAAAGSVYFSTAEEVEEAFPSSVKSTEIAGTIQPSVKKIIITVEPLPEED